MIMRASRTQLSGVKDLSLVALVALLAWLVIYASDDSHTAFGLRAAPAYSQSTQPPTVTVPTDIVLTQQFFELNNSLAPVTPGIEPTEAVLRDPDTPPPVEEFSVVDTNVGREIAVFWHVPEGAEAVRITRSLLAGGEKEVIVERATVDDASEYIDHAVENGKAYRYEAVTLIGSEQSTVITAQATPSDTVPPSPPTDVTVTQIDILYTKNLCPNLGKHFAINHVLLL